MVCVSGGGFFASELYFERNKDVTRGQSWKLKKCCARRDNREYFFSKRVVDIWNSLGEKIIKA